MPAEDMPILMLESFACGHVVYQQRCFVNIKVWAFGLAGWQQQCIAEIDLGSLVIQALPVPAGTFLSPLQILLQRVEGTWLDLTVCSASAKSCPYVYA